MKDLLVAISFLTILPVGRLVPAEENALARSMAFFPVVGLVLGLLASLLQYLLLFFLPKALVLWSTIVFLCILTRALHLDGFADTIDGLASGGTREEILDVMRDSRIGAFGVIGLVLLLGAKYLCLDPVPVSFLSHSLILMTVLGRSSMVLVCYRSAYARSAGGLAKPFTEHLGAREVLLSSAFALVISSFLFGIKGAVIFLGVGIFSLGYRFFFKKRLGGVTGDVLGAANELAELLCLLLIVIFEFAQARS
jgi:adenosylcobinamide-GDP ribazoletransferase